MEITDVIGKIPYRLALAGGWIDQPFISRLNPSPPGSMVVVSLEPTTRYMERCGIAGGTRRVATQLWNGMLPDRPYGELVRELYAAENEGSQEPSGSQDMIGLIYPGISRLDYDAGVEGGYFPSYIESCCEEATARWLEGVIQIIPVQPRPPGYNPLGIKNLSPDWIQRLGETGQHCFAAILAQDLRGLGESLNECMRCWEAVLPHTVSHPTIDLDLGELLKYYQARYDGAMYSGCGGGYLVVASDETVPGGARVKVRLGDGQER